VFAQKRLDYNRRAIIGGSTRAAKHFEGVGVYYAATALEGQRLS